MLDPVNQIGDLLASLDHRVIRVPVHHDLKWLDQARRAELVVNLCEGIGGVSRWECMVAGTLELLGVPFTGAGSWTTTICHNKAVVNALLQAAGLPVPRWLVPVAGKVPSDFPLPAIVKPAAEDASVGIDQASVATSHRLLRRRVAHVEKEYGTALVQQYIGGREFAVGIVGSTTLPLSEIDFSCMPEGAWPILSFDAKWTGGCPEDLGTQPVCPARVESWLARRLRAAALSAWRAVRGQGYGRVDLRLDQTGQPWVLEVNPNPDISDDAGLSRMAQAAGWSYDDLILRMVELARSTDRRPLVEAPPLEVRTA
ncbi:MAG: D-alanine--D-alanine ligase [Gemmatimonadetes bacterium]|nr:D-alanine--D-alanine ligase [Gemmatimonadota bacterium]